MPQPCKNSSKNTKKQKKTPIIKKKDDRLPQQTIKSRIRKIKERTHPEYGTSKLEEKFAHNFLDKLGLKYVYQFKAESIGRYYDFRIEPDLHGPIIEIQGTYWHADSRVYEGKELTRTQKRDLVIDEVKRKWCEKNSIKLIYIWEKDINEHPEDVMKLLKKELKPYLDGTEENKRKRH